MLIESRVQFQLGCSGAFFPEVLAAPFVVSDFFCKQGAIGRKIDLDIVYTYGLNIGFCD